MAKMPDYENFLHDIAMKALEYEFEGKTIREWIDILKDYQSSKWISVAERLPKCGKRVLITDGAAVFEAYLSISHKWVRSGLLWQENVTHWMPLPEPPKE